MSPRLAAVCALGAAACALGNLATMALAVDFDVARLFAFGSLVDVDDAGERWLLASLWVDVGFYLCLVPVALGLARGHQAGAVAGSVAGSVYALAGAAGAVALALAWPGHFEAFDAGIPGAAQAFADATDFVFRRVWNGVCAGAGAAWWASVASGWRHHRPLALLSAALATASLIEGLASTAGATAVADAVLGPLLALLPVWCLVVARSLLAGHRSVREPPRSG